MPFKTGQQVIFNGSVETILEVRKGTKTKIPVVQCGVVTGYKSKPKTYKLTNGFYVRGNKIKAVK